MKRLLHCLAMMAVLMIASTALSTSASAATLPTSLMTTAITAPAHPVLDVSVADQMVGVLTFEAIADMKNDSIVTIALKMNAQAAMTDTTMADPHPLDDDAYRYLRQR